jgi:hypothetical protein
VRHHYLMGLCGSALTRRDDALPEEPAMGAPKLAPAAGSDPKDHADALPFVGQVEDGYGDQ